MDPAPYVPLATALITLVNTLLILWNRRHLEQLGKRVNGMYLQTLAEAERRGRRLARRAEGERPDGPDATSAPRGSGPQ